MAPVLSEGSTIEAVWSVEVVSRGEEEQGLKVAAETELLFEIISSFDLTRSAEGAALVAVAASHTSLGLSA